MDKHLVAIEEEVLQQIVGRFTEIADIDRRVEMIASIAKKLKPAIEQHE